ncbi:M48 family metallopeptidase [Dehalogenimonas sp. THU2]|uniref:M48 family metallopeptidase n=1 Tax=Dehalogenimonas sp. THU2 TaxID=3151121 RepID=UPI0032189717
MAALDAGRQRQAAEYARKRRRIGIITLVLTVALVATLIFTPLSGNLTAALPDSPVLAAALYFALLMFVYALITLPLDYYGGLVLPRRYGLSRQDNQSWLADHVKSLSMGIAFGAIAVAALYFMLQRSPDWWWLFAWAALMAVSLLLTVLAPVVIIPMFFKMKPMKEGELKDRLEALAARTGVKVGGIYVIEFSEKTTLANAAVMGLGYTKRVAISDTLIEQYSPDEIELVMAHELAHQRHADVWRLYGFQAVTFMFMFGLGAWVFDYLVTAMDYVNLTDPAALLMLLVALFAAGVPAMPLSGWFSRRLEAAADAYALDLTGNPEVFISAMTKLTDQNLSEARSSSFFERLGQGHPSYNDRVKMAEEFRSQMRRIDT